MIFIKELLVTLSYMIQFAEGKIESLSRYYQLAISYRQIGPVYKNPTITNSVHHHYHHHHHLPPLWSLVTCTPAAALSVEKVEQALCREQPEQIFSTSKLGNSTLV